MLESLKGIAAHPGLHPALPAIEATLPLKGPSAEAVLSKVKRGHDDMALMRLG